MKKIIIVIAILLTPFAINAQDTAKVYAGLVGSGFISTENSKNISKFANLRVGVNFEKSLSKKTQVKTWVTFDPGSNLIIFQAIAKTSLAKDLDVQYGYGPTPATLIRPFPLSVDGQFQFTAEAIPPGGALGGFVSYKNTKFGIYTRDGCFEYHLGQNIGPVSVGLWTTQKNNSGGTIQIATKWLYVMGTITNQDQQALATSIKISKKSSWKLVHNLGLQKGEVTDNLIGLLYPMKIKGFTDSRFGFGYDFKNKSAGAFWLIGLDR